MDELTPEIWKRSLGMDQVGQEEKVFALPEKVLQFGTGVLLRALPDYFIDQANKAGVFNGRIVIVKSTLKGDLRHFKRQNCLYTHIIRGVENGKQVEEALINSSVSRVLSAQEDWQEVMKCAENPEMQIIISNTTEAGLILEKENIFEGVPHSFPAKLLAWLLHRFNYFKGDQHRGMVIIPTELVPQNGDLLKQLLIELSDHHSLPVDFKNWLTSSNHFCTSLVDRIVPGKLTPADQEKMEGKLGYQDPLMIASEPYALWAIKVKEDKIKNILSFSSIHRGVVLTSDISNYVELKLRLLNGSHTFNCALAFLSGFRTVREAMEDELFLAFTRRLLLEELVPSVVGAGITDAQAQEFALNTLERFRNPFIEHPWINISLQYTSKMKIRNIPTFQKAKRVFGAIPSCMVLGFAAYLLFMKCKKEQEGTFTGRASFGGYIINDDKAGFLCSLWEEYGETGIAAAVCSAKELWDFELSSIPDFIQQVNLKLQQLIAQGVQKTLASTMNG